MQERWLSDIDINFKNLIEAIKPHLNKYQDNINLSLSKSFSLKYTTTELVIKSTMSKIMKNCRFNLARLKIEANGITSSGNIRRVLICCASFIPLTFVEIKTTSPMVVSARKGELRSIIYQAIFGNMVILKELSER